MIDRLGVWAIRIMIAQVTTWAIMIVITITFLPTPKGLARKFFQATNKTDSRNPSAENPEIGIGKILSQLMSEDPKDIRVCSQLGQVEVTAEQLKGVDVRLQIAQALNPDRVNAMNEAYRIPIRSFFQESSVKPVLGEFLSFTELMRDPSVSENQTWLEKAAFYGKVVKATLHVYLSRKKFESLANSANHLHVIATAAALNRSIATSEGTLTLCHQIEDSIKTSEELDLQDERRAVLDFLTAVQIAPADIGFDPGSWVHFGFNADQGGVHVAFTRQ